MPPGDPRRIKSLFAQARTAQTTGDLAQAVTLYQTILTLREDLAEVHFNLGQIYGAQGAAQRSATAFRRAVQIKPAEPAIWAAWIEQSAPDMRADLAAGLRRSGIAEPVLSQLLVKAGVPPRKSGSQHKTALAEIRKLMAAGRNAQAEKKAAALHRKHPDSAVAALALARIYSVLGKPARAETAFAQATALDPLSAESHAAHGAFLLSRGRGHAAIGPLKAAIEHAPKDLAHRVALGLALLLTRDLTGAGYAFEHAVAAGHRSGELSLGLGKLALALKDDAAVAHLQEATCQGLDTAELHMSRGLALQAAMRMQEAGAAFDTAISRAPAVPEYLVAKANFLRAEGDFVQARALIAEAIRHEPENGSLYLLHVSTGKPDIHDPIATQARALYTRDKREDRYLAFAMARLAESDPSDNPFPYLKRANDLSRAAFPYAFDADARAVAAVREAFDPDLRMRVAGAQTPRPIFVTGLPRSGTTLVEQIIAAHSDVAAGGELGLIGPPMRAAVKAPETGADLAEIAQSYWAKLTRNFPGAARITDKSIASYVHLGFLKLAMPNAHIVVVRRDPRDNALSIYKNMFVDGQHRYANDLADIARFTKLFEQQIAFWNTVWPDAFTQIRYEELIAAPEQMSRRLIRDVGLDWEDACLSFHESATPVKTLSSYQVRQPIYSSSVGGWRRFEAEMAPFLKAYGEVEGD